MEQQLNGQGMSWLFPFIDGAPPLGWLTTVKYVALPVLLVMSQYASMSISQPPNSDDPSVKQTQAILKYLPIMIGAFKRFLYAELVFDTLMLAQCCSCLVRVVNACATCHTAGVTVVLRILLTVLSACRILCTERPSWPHHLLAHEQCSHHCTAGVPQEGHQGRTTQVHGHDRERCGR